MSPAETLSRMITERERDLAELQAELDVLRAGLSKPVPAFLKRHHTPAAIAPPANGVEPSAEQRRRIRKGTRLDMLRRLVVRAGRAGITRHEAAEQMAAICDSPANSVGQMLTILGKLGHARPGPDRRWRVVR